MPARLAKLDDNCKHGLRIEQVTAAVCTAGRTRPQSPAARRGLAAAGVDETFDLTLTIKPGALPHLLSGSDALLQHVEISGNADLASTVQFLFRNLKWDFEDDLSRLVGDIAAHRIANTARDFFAWQKDALLRTGENLAEYWTEEQPLLARPEEVARFSRDVETLRDDVARLEARINRLG